MKSAVTRERRYPNYMALRISDEMFARLHEAALEQDRPLASLVRLILRDWLRGQPQRVER